MRLFAALPKRPLSCIAILSAALAAFVVAGCQNARPRNELVVLVEAPIGEIDPGRAITAYGLKISRLTHEPLVSLDTADGRPRMELLERIENPEPLTFVLHLRPGVRFSDGSPLQAADVAWTIEDQRRHFGPFAEKWKNLKVLQILDDLSLKLEFSEVRPTLLTDLDIGVIRRPRDSGDRARLGAGPFVPVSHTPERLVLQRNPFYYKGTPFVSTVVFQTVEEENIRALLMIAGHADVAQNNISPLMLPALMHLPRQSGPSWTLTYVGFNLAVPQLADPRVRRALAMAVDRKALIDARFRGAAQPADSIMPPQHHAHAAGLPMIPFDPQSAGRLLDEAGYPANPATGIRFSLEYKTSSNPFRVAIARVIAASWRRIGIDARVRPLEWGVFFADVKQRRFQVLGLQMPEIGVPDILYDFFHSSSIPSPRRPDGANRWGYASAEVDAWLDLTRITMDPAERARLFARIQEKLASDLPIFPLWFEENWVFLSTRIREYKLLPNARFSSLSRVRLDP